MSIHSEALSAIRALREWIKAVPADVAAALPAMPGVDGDWLDKVETSLQCSVAPMPLVELHAEIMNLPLGIYGSGIGDIGIAYRKGHSDARHMAAELVMCAKEKEAPASNNLSALVLSNAAMLHQLSSDKEAGIFGRLQHVAQARKDCPMCHGDSGYHRAVPVDGTLPTGNPYVPMTAQYVACARCDGADGGALDGAHWHRDPVLPIGYEAQPANGQRIAGLSDQRQNEPQIIPETISAPLADHIAERGNMVALNGDPPLCVSDFGKEVRNAE